MAEVGLEEFVTTDEISVVGNNLSLSPFAVVHVIVLPGSALLFVRYRAANDSSDVLSDVLWGTEVILRNQFSSIVEGTSAWAVFSGCISWAVIPGSIVGHVRSGHWVAELFSEESGLVEWCFLNNPLAFSVVIAHACIVNVEAWVDTSVRWLSPAAESSVNDGFVVTLWSIPGALSSASPWVLDLRAFRVSRSVAADECS
jgi:hypothetical protein